MYYGDPIIRKSVPLALGLISASNPQLTILDTLSKYSHDNDLEVALNAIFAMGLVGAGTNNARLAQMLRQLAGYYQKEPDCLFMVRVSQVRRSFLPLSFCELSAGADASFSSVFCRVSSTWAREPSASIHSTLTGL